MPSHPLATLVEPRADLRDTYRGFVAELAAADEPAIPFPLSYPCDDFPALIARLRAESAGEGLPDGFVANSTFWLIDTRERLVGVSNLRHALTPTLREVGGTVGYGVRPSCRRSGYGSVLLRETLGRARALGLEHALITCADTNAGSIGVIRANGGVYEGESFVAARDECIQRYWIAL